MRELGLRMGAKIISKTRVETDFQSGKSESFYMPRQYLQTINKYISF